MRVFDRGPPRTQNTSVDKLRQNFSFLEAPQFRSSQSLVDPMMVRLEIHSGLLHGQASAVDDSTHLASINDSRRGYPSWCFARSAAPSEFRYDVIKRAFADILYCGISTWPAATCRAQVKKKKKNPLNKSFKHKRGTVQRGSPLFYLDSLFPLSFISNSLILSDCNN